MILGNNSYIIGNKDDYPDTVIIGSYSSIAKNLTVNLELNHPCIENKKLVSSYPFYERLGGKFPACKNKGGVTIGNDVWIGSDVTIMSGVSVGNGAIIASNSVVTKDVPPYAMVAGNPAREKYKRFSDSIAKKLEEIAWWEWEEKEVIDRLPDFQDVVLFVDKYKKGESC